MGSLWPPEVEFGEETANALAVDCKQDEGKRPPRQIASLAHLSNVTIPGLSALSWGQKQIGKLRTCP